MNLPAGFAGSPALVTQLASGRLLCGTMEWLATEDMAVESEVTGYRGGYALWDPDRGTVYKNRLHVVYSDDEGKTWQGTEQPIDISPLEGGWAVPYGRFIEGADGTISMTVYGCLSEQDTRERLDCCGLFRSSDDGESWGDFCLIAYDEAERWTAYNEMDIAVVSDQLWVAFMRTEYRISDNGAAWMSRAISTDGGHTWSQPELCFIGGVPTVELLPDGAIAVGHSGGVHLTYDLGRTWSRILPAGGYAVPILLDNHTLLVGNQHWAVKGGSFDVWRRIPAGEGYSQ